MALPSAESVAVAWIKDIPAILANQVATSLPGDINVWAQKGFVQVPMVVGGSPRIYIPVRNPVVQVDCYATTVGSSKPPWGMASRLAELIVAATYDQARMNTTLDTLPIEFDQVRVMSAYPLTEPRRIPGDDAGFARYQFDLRLVWRAA